MNGRIAKRIRSRFNKTKMLPDNRVFVKHETDRYFLKENSDGEQEQVWYKAFTISNSPDSQRSMYLRSKKLVKHIKSQGITSSF